MKFFRMPFIMRWLFPKAVFDVKSRNNIYLTFDDGPVPGVTDWVLDCLKEYGAKATFFCVGEQVEKYPQLYKRILQEGHQVGNHTYSHVSGWSSGVEEYFEEVSQCKELVSSTLFRPPYGKITRSQYEILRREYKIIMWSVMSYDFQEDMSVDSCVSNVLKNTSNGDVIVFHDSSKAEKNVKGSLPVVLREFRDQGFKMCSLA